MGSWPITVTLTVKDAIGNAATSDSITFNYIVAQPCADPSKYTLSAGAQPAFKTDAYSNTLVQH